MPKINQEAMYIYVTSTALTDMLTAKEHEIRTSTLHNELSSLRSAYIVVYGLLFVL